MASLPLSVSHTTLLDACAGLIPPAFTIALLASIESLLCVRVADGFIGDKHNPNTELIAQVSGQGL